MIFYLVLLLSCLANLQHADSTVDKSNGTSADKLTEPVPQDQAKEDKGIKDEFIKNDNKKMDSKHPDSRMAENLEKRKEPGEEYLENEIPSDSNPKFNQYSEFAKKVNESQKNASEAGREYEAESLMKNDTVNDSSAAHNSSEESDTDNSSDGDKIDENSNEMKNETNSSNKMKCESSEENLSEDEKNVSKLGECDKQSNSRASFEEKENNDNSGSKETEKDNSSSESEDTNEGNTPALIVLRRGRSNVMRGLRGIRKYDCDDDYGYDCQYGRYSLRRKSPKLIRLNNRRIVKLFVTVHDDDLSKSSNYHDRFSRRSVKYPCTLEDSNISDYGNDYRYLRYSDYSRPHYRNFYSRRKMFPSYYYISFIKSYLTSVKDGKGPKMDDKIMLDKKMTTDDAKQDVDKEEIVKKEDKSELIDERFAGKEKEAEGSIQTKDKSQSEEEERFASKEKETEGSIKVEDETESEDERFAGKEKEAENTKTKDNES